MDMQKIPKWMWLAAVAAFGGLAWKMYGASGPAQAASAAADGFERTNEEGGIFTRPIGVKSAPLLLVYGGVTKYDYATKEGMERAMPKDVKLRAFCFFVNYKSGEADKYLAAAERLAQKYGLTFTSKKLMGFSGGGSEVQRANMSAFSFVGLIDPFTSVGNTSLPFGPNVKMLYRPLNWGGSASMLAVRKALPAVARAVQASGGEATEVTTRHADMPAEFFKKYAAQLVA